MTRLDLPLFGGFAAAVAEEPITQFQQYMHACENHNHTQLYQYDHCLEQMQQAALLYKGDLLPGINLKDAYPFEEWLFIQREQLQVQAEWRQVNTLRERYQTPDLRAEIDYALWQITGDREMVLRPKNSSWPCMTKQKSWPIKRD